MIDWSVPIFNSSWSGTGTVMVESVRRFCMTTWLPRWRTITKPWRMRMVQISRPEKTPNLPNGYLQTRDVDLFMQAARDLFG